MGDPIACAACRAFYQANRDALTAACASVGIEHSITQGEALRTYLDGYHTAGHDREGRLSAYRTAARALDVKAALRERGHHVSDEGALQIVHTWIDTNAGPTAVTRAMSLAGVQHSPLTRWTEADTACLHADQAAVWAALDGVPTDAARCVCGHWRAAHDDEGCQHVADRQWIANGPPPATLTYCSCTAFRAARADSETG